MGLDQYALAIRVEDAKNDFSLPKAPSFDVCYWRKNYWLHYWLWNLAKTRGFNKNRFSYTAMRLYEKDILALKKAVKSGEFARIPVSEIESKYNSNDEQRDLSFCKQALNILKHKYAIYYVSDD